MAVYTSEIRAQAGTQSAYTTSVTPTIALRGIEEMPLKSANKIEVIGDMTQALAGGDTAITNELAGAGTFKGWASYDHLPYFWDNLFSQATASGSSPYVRTYAAPTTARSTPRVLTLVKGDGTVGAYKLTGALQTDFTLKVETAKRVEISGSLIGTGLAATTLASLSANAVTPIQASHVSTVKMDSWAGTMGTTALTNCDVRFLELMIKPDRVHRMCLGILTAGDYVEKPWQGSLKMSLQFNATSKTDIDLFVAGLSQRQVEFILTTGSTQIMKIQFAGTLTNDVEVFRDDDGVATVDFELTRTYHPTFANWIKVTHTNTISTAAMV